MSERIHMGSVECDVGCKRVSAGQKGESSRLSSLGKKAYMQSYQYLSNDQLDVDQLTG